MPCDCVSPTCFDDRFLRAGDCVFLTHFDGWVLEGCVPGDCVSLTYFDGRFFGW